MENVKILCDTDIFVEYLKGNEDGGNIRALLQQVGGETVA